MGIMLHANPVALHDTVLWKFTLSSVTWRQCKFYWHCFEGPCQWWEPRANGRIQEAFYSNDTVLQFLPRKITVRKKYTAVKTVTVMSICTVNLLWIKKGKQLPVLFSESPDCGSHREYAKMSLHFLSCSPHYRSMNKNMAHHSCSNFIWNYCSWSSSWSSSSSVWHTTSHSSSTVSQIPIFDISFRHTVNYGLHWFHYIISRERDMWHLCCRCAQLYHLWLTGSTTVQKVLRKWDVRVLEFCYVWDLQSLSTLIKLFAKKSNQFNTWV